MRAGRQSEQDREQSKGNAEAEAEAEAEVELPSGVTRRGSKGMPKRQEGEERERGQPLDWTKGKCECDCEWTLKRTLRKGEGERERVEAITGLDTRTKDEADEEAPRRKRMQSSRQAKRDVEGVEREQRREE